MQNQRFDHTLTLKMTSEMRDDIDRALILVQDSLIRTRSEFIRAACQYALDSLAGGWGELPLGVEDRKKRVLSGGNELGAGLSDQMQSRSDSEYPPPRWA